MATLTYTPKQNVWLKGETENPDRFSREKVTVASGNSVVSGEVMGKITKSCPTTGTAGTNTGTGACGSVTAAAKAKLGTYTLTCIAAATNGGTFSVVTPEGYSLPDASVGVAYASGHINFTIADGGTDFAAGDTFTIEITDGSGEVVPIDFTAVDGSQEAYGLMVDDVDATTAATGGVVIKRDAYIQSNNITWPDGATTAQKAAALKELAAMGIEDTAEV